jgi:hypothetical protein
VLISHRIALDPNHAQATYFARAAGTARFAYHWALSEWRRQCSFFATGVLRARLVTGAALRTSILEKEIRPRSRELFRV